MTWDNFMPFALGALVCWITGAIFAWKPKFRKISLLLSLAGIGVFLYFIVGLWISLERPPMRTMGETRLLYSLFVAIVGVVVYVRWRYAWIPVFSTILSGVFIVINILKPQIHDQALMPALQSPWFVPHVIVYMFSYALMGCALLLLLYGLFPSGKIRRMELLKAADNMVYTGTALLTIGMLFGAIWAKQAWGNYWNWDPKETWAALTWFSYLSYIHIRHRYSHEYIKATLVLGIAFLFLQICWYGINYLPAATQSIHTYGMK
ncbi:MAG: cytochrome c biogenesis protein CcsA [Odoribacter sp.]